jgi:hypothetical protein
MKYQQLHPPMNTLYDSEYFVVVHMMTSMQEDELQDSNTPQLTRHGFEIVDKRSGKEVYLEGGWAELFQQHISAWHINAPTQDEVEDTLSRFAELAQTTVTLH